MSESPSDAPSGVDAVGEAHPVGDSGKSGLVAGDFGAAKEVAAQEENLTTTKGQPKRPDEDYRDWPGSLEEDIGLKCHEIPDDDERWVVLCPGVKKLRLRLPGDRNAPKPEDGDLTSIHFSSFLHQSGELITTSRRNGAQRFHKFIAGQGKMIKGLEVGVLDMPVGERAILRCSPEYAYGEEGWTPSKSTDKSVPPNSILDVLVQVEWVEKYEPIKDKGVSGELIKRRVIGESWQMEQPKEWQTVTISYVAQEGDEKGRIFCERENEEIRVPLDLEFEDQGWIPEYDHPRVFYHCLKFVKVGEKVYFKIKSANIWSYGEKGHEKFGVQPNTDLCYCIKLHKVGACLFDVPESEEESKEKAKELKDMANTFFRQSKIRAAKQVYKEVLTIMKLKPPTPEDDKPGMKIEQGGSNASFNIGIPLPKKNRTPIKTPETEKIDEDPESSAIKVACFSNIALVELKLQNLGEADNYIRWGLRLDPKHEKLRYRKALLHYERAEFAEAVKLLENLEREFPENNKIPKLKTKIIRRQKGAKRRKIKVAKKMFKETSRTKCARMISKLPRITFSLLWSAFLVLGSFFGYIMIGPNAVFKWCGWFGVLLGMISYTEIEGDLNRSRLLQRNSFTMLLHMTMAGLILKDSAGTMSWARMTVVPASLLLSLFHGYKLFTVWFEKPKKL